ncbi:MAG: hypothetical protein IH586_04455 [Anaerolineaceae bacterium]|nr:hypothetical protein [Anaerolineaceae bacterium]
MENRTLTGTNFFKLSGLSKLFLLVVIGLVSCSPAAAQAPTLAPTAAPTSTDLPTATQMPTASPTLAPTATLEPTATPVPPTATPMPPLAVLDDGFNVWGAPLDYAGTKAQGPDEPAYARKMVKTADLLQASIPATYCVVVYHFNQPVPAGLTLAFIDGKSIFLKQPLVAAEGQPDVAWTSVSHSYVINPPLWWVDYTLTVLDPAGKEIWTNPVQFAKPLPEPCIYGGLPDPVTMWCTITDPWEIEPHPGVTYPYDRSRLTPGP